jgi:hypothetical protein
MKIIPIVLCLLLLNTFARKGPNNKGIRALGMGNAFVAVAEDKDAIYYNPAGLNLMNKLGNYEKRPDLGYYPDNWLDMRIGIGALLPDLVDVGTKGVNAYNNHNDTFKKLSGDSAASALAEDTTLYNDFTFIDRYPIKLGIRTDMEIAFHNFGAAFWTEVTTTPFIDMGIIVPGAGVKTTEAYVVGQLAFAFEWNKKLSFGTGYRLVKYAQFRELEIGIDNATSITDTLQKEATSILAEAADISHAFDIGTMYQWQRDVRLGAALQNIFIGDLNGESVTPELTFGIAYSPRKLQRNTAYSRKVNFALDFEDALNNDKNYKFFSHLNFGAEFEQILLAIPSVTLGSNARLLKGRVAGGFKGGYWTAGLGLELVRFVHLDIVSWADETGYFTGQEPERTYVVEIAIGL